MKKIFGLLAIFIVLMMLIPASTATMNMKQSFTDPISISTERQIIPFPDNDPDEEGDDYVDDIPGVTIDYVEGEEPDEGDDLPGSPGGDQSFLLVRGLYYLDWDLRFRLYQLNVIEWVWFDGNMHESDTVGYIEIWEDDGQQTYHTGDFHLHHVWWGGPRLAPSGIGFKLTMDCSEPWLWVHVYAERTVEGFPVEVTDQWIYKHLIYP